jgi:hypothetical protein
MKRSVYHSLLDTVHSASSWVPGLTLPSGMDAVGAVHIPFFHGIRTHVRYTLGRNLALSYVSSYSSLRTFSSPCLPQARTRTEGRGVAPSRSPAEKQQSSSVRGEPGNELSKNGDADANDSSIDL